MTLLIIDSSTSGAAGDMLIAAMLDLCSEEQRNDFCSKFQSKLVEYDPQFKLKWKNVKIEGFSGVQLVTKAKKRFPPHELEDILKNLTQVLLESERSAQKVTAALDYLIRAEKNIHGVPAENENLHFHELATLDTIIDILGFYYLLEFLQEEEFDLHLLPIAVGGGKKKISHGLVSVPAPATTEIISMGNLKIHGGPVNEELLTPTGAAILASLQAKTINYLPSMEIGKIGRSFGTHSPKEGKQSFLRILLGKTTTRLHSEEVMILETNVDDVDGETIGYLFDILFRENLVLDFIAINTLMKKNRPGYLLQAIVEPEKVQEVSLLLIRELGTLGVRVLSGFRHIIPRNYTTHKIMIGKGEDNVKVKRGFIGDEMIKEKVEYEDLKRIALKKKQPLRMIRKNIDANIKKENDSNA
ncbi:MAG: nickel pincer cofactor biosynthesis protein LarC [Candidatus Hodarchaeales archaeon]|jgi:uncharacterized protein (TIGR00299 family) protein